MTFDSSDNKYGYWSPPPEEEEWPDPQSLHSEMRPVQQFDPEMLPEILRAWVADVAERMQCPIDFVAVGAICALSGVIGAGCSVRPKKHDNWSVVPNLWGGVIAAPGKKKTPALQEAMLPLKRLEVEAAEEYEREQGAHEAEKIAFEAQKKKLKEGIEKASGAKLEELKQQFAELQPPAPPIARRYMTTDATIESIGVLIRDNPRGLTIYRDELIGLLVSWDREDHKQDRAFHIQGWNGDGSYTYDRISRGRIFVPHLCETILGGIQPSKFHVYLALTKNNIENDGLLQRFQTLVYPDTPNGKLETVDLPPDKEARELVFSIFAMLAKMDFVACGAQTEEHAKIPFFHFDEQAQQFFYDWALALEAKRRIESESIIVEHLSKFDSLMPSLALIFHLVERANYEFQRSVSSTLPEPSKQVSLESAKLASEWCEYLESHARRIYGLALDLSGQAAQRILDKIEEGALHDNFNERDIYRRGWSFLDSKELAHAAIAELLETGWVRENKVAKTQELGRPLSPTYRIHPRAQEILRRRG